MIKIKDGRSLEKGQKVRIYRNLRNGLFSIVDEKSRLVCGYSDSFLLENVHFVIYKKSQERAREKWVRNVHAFAVGEFNPDILENIGKEITYNPFVHETFIVKETRKPIYSIDRLICIHSKIYKCY